MYPSNNKYNLVLCEIHFTPIHGKTKDSDKYIENHFLVISKINPHNGKLLIPDENGNYVDDEDSDEDDDEEELLPQVDQLICTYKYLYEELLDDNFIGQYNHNTIRNYENIIRSRIFLRPQIAECIKLPTEENICILKTFWINIIIRAWKKAFMKKKELENKRNSPRSLRYRECFGVWPDYCRSLPSIRGLLKDLK